MKQSDLVIRFVQTITVHTFRDVLLLLYVYPHTHHVVKTRDVLCLKVHSEHC